MLVTGLGVGGAEKQVAMLAAGLTRRGVDVRVLSLVSAPTPNPAFAAHAIPVSSLGMRRGWADIRHLARYVRYLHNWRPDVVHSHMVHANLLARCGRLLVPVPVICTAHALQESPTSGSGSRLKTWLREFSYRLSDPLCEITTHVSMAGASRYVAIKAAPPDKMIIIPNGVDLATFAPNAGLRVRTRQALNIAESFVWLAIGRLELVKDYSTMLSAFKTASASRNCRLLIVGSGSAEGRLRREASQLQVSSRVSFLGTRDDIPALLNAADGYVLSSLQEGFPMVLIEAGAVGLPLVVTNAGGAPEAVMDGVSGWVVPTRDPFALAAKMCALMDLPLVERERIGAQSRSFVAARFSLDSILDRWTHLYTRFT